jgi:hypothetical protein
MSEAARGKSVEIKDSQSDKAELPNLRERSVTGEGQGASRGGGAASQQASEET